MGALEDAKGLSCQGPFGSFLDPCFGRDVVGEEECGQVWVMILLCQEDGCGDGDIIDYDGGILKGIDADLVPRASFARACLDGVQSLEMPPELEIHGVATSRV